ELEVYRQADIEVSIANIGEVLPYLSQQMPTIIVFDEFGNETYIAINSATMTGKMRVDVNNQGNYTLEFRLNTQELQITGACTFNITKEVIKAGKISLQIEFIIDYYK
ncbi:MAG: hypothetical protein RR416_04975, partial [Clostridia bacterium]